MSLIPSGELKEWLAGLWECPPGQVSMSLIPSGELKGRKQLQINGKQLFVSMSLIPSGELKEKNNGLFDIEVDGYQ